MIVSEHHLVFSCPFSLYLIWTNVTDKRGLRFVTGGPRARTCFACDYTESRTCTRAGSVFIRPRNPRFGCVMFDACLRHPSRASGYEREKDKRGPVGIRIRALRDERVPTSSKVRSGPGDSGFLSERSIAWSSRIGSSYDAGTCRN